LAGRSRINDSDAYRERGFTPSSDCPRSSERCPQCVGIAARDPSDYAIGVAFQQVQKYEKGVNRVGSGRLYRIADTLKIPVTYFFDGLAGPKKVAGNISGGLEFVRTAGTLRLLRAFEKMDRRAQGHFLALIEIMTSGRKAGRPPSIH